MNSAAMTSKEYKRILKTEAADFSRLARVYRWLEWFSFGPALWRCRCAYLDAMNDRHRALIIGDGDGRFTARLLQANSRITIEAVDASEAMLRQLLRRAAANVARLHTTTADIREPISFGQRFDLVVTHFFLDCLTTEEVETLAWNLRESLSPGARWVVSEFAIPTNLYGRLFARPLVSALYSVFGLLTGLTVRRLPDYREALQRAGFVLTQERKWLQGLLGSEVWQRSCERA